MVRVFISYSHKDEDLRAELVSHLSLLRRQGAIHPWDDRQIAPGIDIDVEIISRLDEAEVILLLVSADFLASEYCADEVARAMQRHMQGTARVIPVILRPCDWHEAPFGNLKALPNDGKPVVKHASHDDGFLEIAQAVRQVSDPSRLSTRPVGKPDFPSVTQPRPIQPKPHSSNLNIRRNFTDRDRQNFINEEFKYISDFFENSLNELQLKNRGLEGDFHRLNVHSFEVRVFVDGQEKGRCGIWIDSRLGSDNILFSSGGVNTMSSHEESISVGDDGYELFLKAMGMSWLGQMHGKDLNHLTREEAAEYLWSLLIERFK